MSHFAQENAPSFDDGVTVKALVKWFNIAKGFGFVAPADGTPDAFLHISVLNRAGLRELAETTEILCEITAGPKGPQVARLLEVIGGPPSGATSFGDASGRAREARCAPIGPTEEMTGTVKWFKPDKGFGFVTADDSGKDVFIHKSVLRRCGLTEVETGQRVQMKVREADKGREATWLTAL